MNKQEYIAQLEESIDYCDCIALRKLRDLNKSIEHCDNKSKLKKYKDKYNAKVSYLTKSGLLKIIMHVGEDFNNPTKIPVQRLPKDSINYLVYTLNCTFCDQPIDIIDCNLKYLK